MISRAHWLLIGLCIPARLLGALKNVLRLCNVFLGLYATYLAADLGAR